MSMRYHDPSLSHDEAISLLATNDLNKITEALISIGLNETDATWAQETCLRYVSNDDENIASAAIIAIGHIARRFGELDMAKISPALQQAKTKSPFLSGAVQDTLDDIHMFT
ncbi:MULTISPECIES: hypothetical protein [unclassified Pseudomonas]|uniref:hypothetical protein n=1 Tax=unclassified Pseudomonas TaxID=196821 RepID=UPI000C85E2D6|nr:MULTISPECIES: hypothetical protein [unclassified Pseudomonas]AUO21674.1 hypothetical protein C0058_06590 [Pseudomonas sp. NC02]NVZ17459.1 hypothetical protein [Pseudomonas sp. IPO3775]NWA79750.1 hypothetical protein [Pseudomonas sp. C8002]PMU14008.1 hypothetical protein C1X90_31340 [Pseudomonas sp. GP01-A9]PMU22936.1 hypothetical protein C1X88_28165 [Pseudomonas sp. GP01-A13]